jgi:ribA/ribD-fused uncharacterized protein
MAINSFEGDNAFLSNFYPSSIKVDDITYPTVEHAFQASKLDPDNLWVKTAISHLDTPGKAKRFGRKVTLRSNWEQIKNSIMLNLLRLKFSNSALKFLLLETGDEELIEGNYWNDTYWGVCNGEGQNHLGKLLMQVREELKNQ